MDILEHIIKQGDTLQSIAREYDLTIDELKDFHNSHCGVASLIVTDKLPIHISYVFIDKGAYKKSINKKDIIGSSEFNYKARYRCEQLNISRLNNEIITLSASTYTEFLIEKMENADVFILNITDNTYEVDPEIYKKGFEFSRKLEKLRYPITFSISSSGIIEKIFNKNEIAEKWTKFRDYDILNDEMYQQLSSQAPEQAKDIIKTGNSEFLEGKNLPLTLDKNLFHHIFFRAFRGDKLENYQLKQFSQLFPNIDIITDVVKSVVTENNDTATYRLVGTLKRDNLSESILKDMYDKIYKPTIKYSYTEFNFIYRITYTIDKKNNFLTEGKASIAEKIKNNFEVITEYNIKRVEA